MSQSDALNQTESTDEKPAGRDSKLVMVTAGIIIIALFASVYRSMTAPAAELSATAPDQPSTSQRPTNTSSELNTFISQEPLASPPMPVEGGNAPASPTRSLLAGLQPSAVLSEDQQALIDAALRDDINGNVSPLAIDFGSPIQPSVPSSTNNAVGARSQELRDSLARLESLRTRASDPGYTELDAYADLDSLTPLASLPVEASADSIDPNAKTLPVGSLIQTSLMFELNSDVSTQFVSMVRYPVYDASRQFILIPTGAKLFGRVAAAGSTNAIIQQRLLLQAEGVSMPDGSIIDLSAQALGKDGATGVQGSTDNHLLTKTAGTFAYGVLAIAPPLAVSNGEAQSAQDEAAGEAAKQFGDAFNPLANQYASIVPTHIIPARTEVNVLTDSLVHLIPYATTATTVNYGGL